MLRFALALGAGLLICGTASAAVAPAAPGQATHGPAVLIPAAQAVQLADARHRKWRHWRHRDRLRRHHRRKLRRLYRHGIYPGWYPGYYRYGDAYDYRGYGHRGGGWQQRMHRNGASGER